jgi:hypothetical protein
MSNFWSTVIDTVRSLLASKGTQLMIRLITTISTAIGVSTLMKEETTNTLAAGGVAFITLILDYISSRIQKTDAITTSTNIATTVVNENK